MIGGDGCAAERGGSYNRRSPCRRNAREAAGTVQISSRQFADVVVAAPLGRVDYAAADRLEHALAPLLAESCRSQRALVLDFSAVDYISSVGLRVLLIAAKQTRAHGAKIAVAGLQPVVAEIFAISRFDNVLDVYASLHDALAALSPAAAAAFDAGGGTPVS